MKRPQRVTRQHSVPQHRSHAGRHTSGHVAIGRWVNSSAIQTAPIARPSRVPQLRPIVRELAPATSPEIAAPSSSRRWWWLTDRVAGFFNERLGAQETKRRLLHATPGLLPFLLWSVPHDDPSSLRFQLVIGGLIVVLAAVAYYQFGRVQWTAERPKDVMRAVFGYATVVLVTMVLGSRHVEVAFAALAILAFGDGSATLGGKLMRGGRLPWNSKKTIAGTFCFILVATPMAALIYWCQAHDVYAVSNFPRVNVEQALLGAFAAAVAAALIESLPMRTNDNLRVGVTAAAVIVLFQWLVVGWV